MWTTLAALGAALLGVIGAFVQKERRPRSYRLAKHQAELLASVPTESASYKAIDLLLASTATKLLEEQQAAGVRVLNGSNLAMAIFVTAVVGATNFALYLWFSANAGSPLGVVLTVLWIVWALVSALLITAAFMTIFKPKVVRTVNTRQES